MAQKRTLRIVSVSLFLKKLTGSLFSLYRDHGVYHTLQPVSVRQNSNEAVYYCKTQSASLFRALRNSSTD